MTLPSIALPPVERLVPHAKPMLLLDSVTDIGDEHLHAEVRIHPGCLFNQGDGVGAWIGIEYMAQAIAAWAGYQALQRGEAVKIGFLLGSRRYECTQATFANGSVLSIEVTRQLQADNGLGSFACRIVDQHRQEVAQASVSVFQPHNAREYLEGNTQ